MSSSCLAIDEGADDHFGMIERRMFLPEVILNMHWTATEYIDVLCNIMLLRMTEYLK